MATEQGIPNPRVRIGINNVTIDGIDIAMGGMRLSRQKVLNAFRKAWQSLQSIDLQRIRKQDPSRQLTEGDIITLKRRLAIDVLRGFVEPWEGNQVDHPFDHVVDADIYLFLVHRFGDEIALLSSYYQLLTGVVDSNEAQTRMEICRDLANH